MIVRFRTTLFAAIAAALSVTSVSGQLAKPPLDHSVYDSWNRISARAISNDGRWVLYRLTPGLGDSQLHVRNVQSGQSFEIHRGTSARFSHDSRFVVFEIEPQDSIVKSLRLEKTKPADLPKDSLGILNLASGEITRVARVKSFALPDEAGGWAAYLHEKPQEEAADSSEGGAGQGDLESVFQRARNQDDGEKKAEGTQLVLRNLLTGTEWRYEDVTAYVLAKNGSRLAYARSSKDGDADGVFAVTLGSDAAEALMTGKGVYQGLALDREGDQIAFLSNRDEFEADQPAFFLYYWKSGSDEARAAVDASTPGVPAGWWVSENEDASFSENGERLFFGTAPRPDPEPEEETPEWEKVVVDIWNWKDPLLQPNQLVQRDRELRRTYSAVLHLDDNRVVQLATVRMPTVTVADSGDGDVGLAVTNMPYRQEISWDSPGYNDVYVVDVNTGHARMLLEGLQGSAQMSPGGKYITWWDGHERAWFAKDVDGGEAVNLTGAIGVRFDDELHDRPMIPRSNRSAGWTEDDELFLVYDKYDIWAVDPTGRSAPRNITEGVGRRENLGFRYVSLDRGGTVGRAPFGGGRPQSVIGENEDLLLEAFDLDSKASGFYRDRVRGNREPERLMMEPRRFGPPQKAKDADVIVFTRESFEEFPDLWASDLSFENMQRLSHANPQQSDYSWGTAEPVEWTSTDGLDLQGILYKPEGFDPALKYPMMVYYYEKMSDQLYAHRAPAPGSSSINISFYVSRGYVVFIPDIYYRDGYPGESALNCLVPGVLSILAKGFIDPERVGIQGHSWGGYQTAYLVTRSNVFAAAEAGAPVSNMTSAYGGIRWQTGVSRMMQYERTQSRLGGTLWEVRQRYIENSPLFWADKIETPVLMMHNDEDGAVPWYQGIEFFVALRRLHKPVWLLNYNGEPHGLRKYQNRKDFAIRMQQFFDHYLKGVPAPVWMVDGVPAVMKGKDLGLEIITEAATSGGGG